MRDGMRKAKTILSTFVLFVSFHSFAKIEATIEITPLHDNPNLIGKIPESKESEIIISRDQYVLSYNKINRAPNWVAWKLDANQLGPVTRTNSFKEDSDLENYLAKNDASFKAVDETEYKGSCFDRGHQVPSADRTASVEDNHSTFLMSNMVPQTPYLNQIIWQKLENFTRDLIRKQNKKVYVVAGPIYDDNFGMIGPKKDIRVPSKSFKVIFILDPNQNPEDINTNTPNISVVMPNTLKDGSKPDFSKGCKQLEADASEAVVADDWQKYKTTLNQVEKEAGIKILK